MNIIDLTSDVCPLALVKLKLALKQPLGGPLLVLLSDPGSKQDVPSFLKKKGYRYENVSHCAGIVQLKVYP
ncbi:sulfurtransferase TusA family protein [Shewanella surugensis]|uniref:Sulfurtransferase TusA family protein n=1 Tax=Shewanella surugensis TaxID=212020 RepID=A0ABT0LHM2_9GAMM|nr:sulfurtransferase TusA family protein [Shewanella surugensis]MCL1126960.1 sulfurtransferase TusA family protein [Shewanella surugensis]